MYQSNTLRNDKSRERPRAASSRATLHLFGTGEACLEQQNVAPALLPKEERCRDRATD
jgi:hypothetical protein